MTEKSVESAIVKHFKKVKPNGFYMKAHGHGMQRRGIPDLYFQWLLSNGLCCVLWVEVKRPDGKTSALQDAMLNTLGGQGASVAVCRSRDEFHQAMLDAESRFMAG